MANKNYLLWDFDGTLAERDGGWSGALSRAAKLAGVRVSPAAVRPFLQTGFPWHAPENEHIGQNPDDWWLDMLPVFLRAYREAGVERGQAAALAQQVRQVYLDPVDWKLFADALPALMATRSAGWTNLLLSNHVPELPSLLKTLGLASHFQAIFNSAGTGWEKPNPHAFRSALAALPTRRGVVVVIGDSYIADVLGAQEAGLPAILVRKKHRSARWFAATLAGIEALALTAAQESTG